MCRLHFFVLDSHLATLWESNFLLVMFPLGSSYFVFVFLSLWCLWWEVWDNCIDSWSLPSFLLFINAMLYCFAYQNNTNKQASILYSKLHESVQHEMRNLNAIILAASKKRILTKHAITHARAHTERERQRERKRERERERESLRAQRFEVDKP